VIARLLRRAASILAGRLAAATLGGLVVVGAVTVVHSSADATTTQQGAPTAGLPSVGALFTVSGPGVLGSHFCTASVVDSPAKDLVVTAAHCVSDLQPDQFVFVPEYHDGQYPFGVFSVTGIFVDRAWQRVQDPDDDFAFLVVAGANGQKPVQEVTGGDRLGIAPSLTATSSSGPTGASGAGAAAADIVMTGSSAGVGTTAASGSPKAAPMLHVVGYPDDLDTPISCTNRMILFTPTQLQFNCGGYTIGTSGSPFVTDVRAATHTGIVLGVIGGFQQGGNTPSVSYAARFEANAKALYLQAIK
jgi:V8-like Glu-specific endopeptidase